MAGRRPTLPVTQRLTLRTLAELGRVSNLPTVASNVLVGVALGGVAGDDVVPWRAWLALVAVALLYSGGMALNDVVDAPVDAVQRSKRPIPSGRVSRRAALVIACLCLVWGLAIAGAMGVAAALVGLALVACIVGYDVLHKRHAWSVVLMGACRGLVYPLSCTMAGGDLEWTLAWPGLAVLAYTIGLTLIARGEHKGEPGLGSWATWRTAAWVLPGVPLIGVLGVPIESKSLGVVGIGLIVAWGIHAAMVIGGPASASHAAASRASTARATQRAVMAWIAGFCLIDAFYLGLMDRPGLMMLAVMLFGVTLLGHRKVSGT